MHPELLFQLCQFRLEPIDSLDDLTEEEQPDVLLDQAAEIISDLIGLAEADVSMLTQAHGT